MTGSWSTSKLVYSQQRPRREGTSRADGQHAREATLARSTRPSARGENLIDVRRGERMMGAQTEPVMFA